MKRIAIIGMSGNSVFFNKIKNKFIKVHEEVGGKGYNQAIACIRNGVNVSYLSAVGNDNQGLVLEDFMKKEGIDTFFVKKNEPTLEAKIYVNEKGDNKVVYNKDNCATLEREDVINFEEQIKESDAVLLQYEYPKEIIEEAIELSKKHNKKVMVNPAPMIYDDLDLLKYVDIITPNEEEAYKLFLNSNKNIEKLIEEEGKSNIKCIINTLGGNGLLVIRNNIVNHYNAIKVNAVDTTGAGDTFNGVFIANVLKGLDFDDAIKRAIVGSGLSVCKKYVMDAIPNQNDIEKYIENNNL